MINYKYNEDSTLAELLEYVNSTYSEHYAEGDIEVTEFLIAKGHGEGHCLGNVVKYAARYGKKEGRNRKDLMKILHYGLMMVYVHDLQEENKR